MAIVNRLQGSFWFKFYRNRCEEVSVTVSGLLRNEWKIYDWLVIQPNWKCPCNVKCEMNVQVWGKSFNFLSFAFILFILDYFLLNHTGFFCQLNNLIIYFIRYMRYFLCSCWFSCCQIGLFWLTVGSDGSSIITSSHSTHFCGTLFIINLIDWMTHVFLN